MKDLIQEGRKIQEAFNTKMIIRESVSKKYANEVWDEYDTICSKNRKIGEFSYRSNLSFNDIWDPTEPSEWYARTKSGGYLTLFFAPFYTNDVKLKDIFEIEVSFEPKNEIGSKTYLPEFKKFRKSINPSNDTKKDGKLAFQYIKKILTSPEIKQAMER